MDDGLRRSRMRTFVIGGIVGASAALAAASRRRKPKRRTPVGLAAFEDAPCYEETLRQERTGARS